MESLVSMKLSFPYQFSTNMATKFADFQDAAEGGRVAASRSRLTKNSDVLELESLPRVEIRLVYCCARKWK